MAIQIEVHPTAKRAALVVGIAVLFVVGLTGLRSLLDKKEGAEVKTSSAPPDLDVWFSPNGGATEAIVKVISGAGKSIEVQAYSFTSAPIAEALIQAKRRGVEVTAILDDSQRADKNSQANRIAEGEIATYFDSKHAIAHNKVIIVDGLSVVTGSFNFSKAAEENNAENLLVVRDPGVAGMYHANFRQHLAHSVPLRL